MLVLGAGAGRLAYDIHDNFDCAMTVAMDFNPMLMLVAQTVTRGDTLELYEFPIAPQGFDDGAVKRTLSAPKALDDGFQLVLGDALRAPFRAGAFDTIVTPWLIDIIDDDLGTLQPGLAADLLVLDANPLDDIRAMRQIDSVWIAGKQLSYVP